MNNDTFFVKFSLRHFSGKAVSSVLLMISIFQTIEFSRSAEIKPNAGFLND